MSPSRLLVFLKTPRVGTVKTRLACDVGDVEALKIYRQLVERVIENLKAVGNVELRFTPDEARTEIEAWLKHSWTARSQGPGDLGERMDRAFAESFDQGVSKAVLIGSDCPAVTEKDIEEAFVALNKNDLVLGPATDGGYWLIGLTRPRPELFCDMKWGVSDVLSETLLRAGKLGLSCALLSEKTDIDDLETWRDYQAGWAGEKSS